MDKQTDKTWARETALALLTVLCWTIYQENIGMVEVIVWPFTTYAAVAYGLKRVESGGLLRDKPSQPANGRGS